MKPKISHLILFTLIVNIIAANAMIRFVSKSGTSTPPYTSWQTAADSIQKCINICVDGDTIYVANGVYKENLIINTAISLIGSSMDSTVIDGRGLTNPYAVEFTNDGSIENFNIIARDFNDPNATCILTLNANLYLKFCQLTNAHCAIFLGEGSTIMDNLIITECEQAVQITCFSSTCNNEISNSLIFTNSSFDAIYLAFSGYTKIWNNLILNQLEWGGIFMDYATHKGADIHNNLIANLRYEHIDLSPEIIIDTIKVYNNLLVYQPQGFLIWYAIFGVDAEIKIENNVIANNYAGVEKSNYSIEDFNLFWNNTINSNKELGDSSIIADPMFVNDTVPSANRGYDFHLQAFSPAIDKGNPEILDLDETRSDIGLYGGPFGETYTYQDLAPLAPRNLSAVVDTNIILLKWNRNTEADTTYYIVYRDTVSDFQIDSTKIVSSSADTFFAQIPPYSSSKYVYKITCVDNQGNQSQPSQELVVNITSASTNDYPMTIGDYVLYQNYPNPFNPTTKIGYQLKQRAYVKLMVYDIKGELVTFLVNKEQNAGYYEVEFNLGNGHPSVPNVPNLASGIYLYRIEVIDEGSIPIYTEMKKMLLLK